MSLPPLLPRDDCHARLQRLFPRAAFDPVLSNPLASAAVAAMLYIGAVVPDSDDPGEDAVWARPSLCLWMSDGVYGRDGPDDRIAWRKAALGRGRDATVALQTSWGLAAESWYRDNSRETLRDETFTNWLGHGAVRVRPGVPTASSKPRWALTQSFATLFSPELTDGDLDASMDTWRETHMSPGDRLRISTARDRERQVHAVTVTLPDGVVRSLEPGEASFIVKGVVEQWAPSRLGDPVVLTISEPGDKVYVADASRLRVLGLTMDPSSVLPDAVIVDIAARPPEFWIVEAVASDGPVDEDRRRALLRWAGAQRIDPAHCRFLSAFSSRNSPSARKRLKDLAAGTFAWYADEPGNELAWSEIEGWDALLPDSHAGTSAAPRHRDARKNQGRVVTKG
ncbi:MAG: restriction endonuclease [Actinomycetota bacterium]|nr:restriction endonuclease [Actinomycetota bacterium]